MRNEKDSTRIARLYVYIREIDAQLYQVAHAHTTNVVVRAYTKHGSNYDMTVNMATGSPYTRTVLDAARAELEQARALYVSELESLGFESPEKEEEN